MTKSSKLQDEVNLFLDDLRDSGVTNMYGAARYIQEEYSCDKQEAKDFLLQWMESKS
jgi:hypothetical protein